jgi:hypothetical protein
VLEIGLGVIDAGKYEVLRVLVECRQILGNKVVRSVGRIQCWL